MEVGGTCPTVGGERQARVVDEGRTRSRPHSALTVTSSVVNTPPNPHPFPHDPNPMMIAMGVLGGVVGAFLVGLGLYCFLRWRRKALESRLDLEKAGAAYKELPESVRHTYMHSPMLKQAQTEGWLIPANQIEMQVRFSLSPHSFVLSSGVRGLWCLCVND